MPLQKGSSNQVVSQNIKELHQGKTYQATAAKFGEARAHQQSIAIAMDEAGRSNRHRKGGLLPRPKRPFKYPQVR